MNKPVNNAIYMTYGDRWYTAQDDPVALLRAESRLKVEWMFAKLRTIFSGAAGVELLDVGCGGGFVANPLAERGFGVTGIDIAADSIDVARRHDKTGSARFLTGDAYALPFPDESFDVVCAMDVLEHLEDPRLAVREAARVLRPGGVFFFHTFNRNWLAGFVAIKLVEWLVRNVPPHMHVLRLFIKPRELAGFCAEFGLRVEETTGILPRFSTIPLRNYVSGIVPESLEFQLIRSQAVAYMGFARKA